MALQSKTIITINGQEIPAFQRLLLQQNIDAGHDQLELYFRLDVLEGVDDELASKTKEFLGEIATIQVTASDGFQGDNYGELNFQGIVTQVKTIKGYDASNGDRVVITVKSPTILFDDGPHFTSYTDMALSEIISTALQDYDPSKLTADVRPVEDPTLHYSVQHNESSYGYLRRLAAENSEWLYYDGGSLIFGEPGSEEINLTYGFDLKEYELSLTPQSNNYKVFSNDYLADEVIEGATSDSNASLNGYGSFVTEKSDALYTKETRVWHKPYVDPELQKRFDTAVTKQKKAIEVKQVKLSGTSDNPGVKIGGIIVVEGNKYRITHIKHTNNEIGDYANTFEAITADDSAYPYTNISSYPKADTQVALVVDNADPEGLGRIKVQFPWQKEENLQTPWLRIVTPHAGLNKGFHFIPEIEEEVLVGFEGANAERPFVLGSLFNATQKVDEFQTDANDAKIIRTRSGHTIELNDTEGEEKINIYDNEGSIIIFDTQAKSLTINATETIDIAAKNINIMAEENISIGAQADIEIASDGDTAIQAQGDMDIQSTGDASLASSGKLALEAATDATVKGANTIVSAQASAEVSATTTKVAGSAMTEVSGGVVKIN